MALLGRTLFVLFLLTFAAEPCKASEHKITVIGQVYCLYRVPASIRSSNLPGETDISESTEDDDVRQSGEHNHSRVSISITPDDFISSLRLQRAVSLELELYNQRTILGNDLLAKTTVDWTGGFELKGTISTWFEVIPFISIRHNCTDGAPEAFKKCTILQRFTLPKAVYKSSFHSIRIVLGGPGYQGDGFKLECPNVKEAAVENELR